MSRRVARHLRVRGHVQGVFYRQWTVDTARGLGLVGWVRNRSDGSVEAVVAGAEAAVERMIECCRDGPPAASVAAVEVDEWRERVGWRFTKLPTL